MVRHHANSKYFEITVANSKTVVLITFSRSRTVSKPFEIFDFSSSRFRSAETIVTGTKFCTVCHLFEILIIKFKILANVFLLSGLFITNTICLVSIAKMFVCFSFGGVGAVSTYFGSKYTKKYWMCNLTNKHFFSENFAFYIFLQNYRDFFYLPENKDVPYSTCIQISCPNTIYSF